MHVKTYQNPPLKTSTTSPKTNLFNCVIPLHKSTCSTWQPFSSFSCSFFRTLKSRPRTSRPVPNNYPFAWLDFPKRGPRPAKVNEPLQVSLSQQSTRWWPNRINMSITCPRGHLFSYTFFKEGKKWPSPSKPTHHYWIMEYLQTSSNGLFKINLARLVLKGRSAARCPFVTTWSDTRRGTFQQGCFPGRGNYTFIVNGRVASIKSCRGESCENTTVNYLVQQFAFWTLAPTKKSLFIIITLLTTLQKKLFRPFYQKWVSPCRKSHCHRGRLQKLEIHISGSSWLGWPSKLCARTRGQWPTPHSSRRGQESKHIFYWLFQSTFPLIRFPSWKVNIFAPPLGNRS